MAKTNKQPPQPKGKKSRPAPYPQKARVEVTFDGPSSSTTPAPSAPATKAPKASSSSAQPEEEKPVVPATVDVKGKGKAVDQDQSGVTQGTFVVVAGSYEKLLYGLEGSLPSSSAAAGPDEGEGAGTKLEPIFIFPAHLACVKAIAASPGGKWLATGSEDEFIKLWDLRRRREMGSLSQHTGSITSLHFPSSSHLVSTSVDGTIALFRTSDWACLKALKGHSGRVNYVDVHPTGRVALSVGKDMTLRMWDLMRGRGAASLALGTEAEIVRFSPLGTHFAVLFPKKVELYSLTLKLLHRIETKSRFNTLEFALIPGAEGEEEEVLCVGTEKGVVEVRKVEIADEDEVKEEDEEKEPEEVETQPIGGATLDHVVSLVGHTNRIKSLSTLSQPVIGSDPSSISRTVLLSTVSSDGYINLYDLSSAMCANASSSESAMGDASALPQVRPVASYNTKGSRLTCVFLADGKKGEIGGEKKPDSEEEDDDEEDGEDMYDQGSDGEEDDEGLDGVNVEFEDEEEEEMEEEGEEE
ncbi:WD40-repeat-containing domain protein [Dioszegia hungarica]|uniref:WD40-repeat-containing domain protein n=1 Tax=Dioszegia hungarica TaxID=4972 RepID=A0AA38HBM7_9TREE|nr:WD40-repeat-containing domain protein [Dioszegia hungarica]KAI9635994.1 WD40-repeat-containing domain protein [Dioszegia hungarica]